MSFFEACFWILMGFFWVAILEALLEELSKGD